MACLVGERIVAQEMKDGRLLLAAPILPGEFWSPDRLRFLDSRTLRFYGTRLDRGKSELELRVLDFDLDTGGKVREVQVPGYDHALREISPDGQRLLLKDRKPETGSGELAIADLRSGQPPAGIPVRGNLSGFSFLPDGRMVVARRSSPARGGRNRIDLHLLDSRGAELKRFSLPGHRVRIGGQPAPGLLVVTLTGEPSEKTSRSLFLDLESGALRPIGKGLYPQGWPGLPPGSLGTQLFVQKRGGLVRVDPMNGYQKIILRP